MSEKERIYYDPSVLAGPDGEPIVRNRTSTYGRYDKVDGIDSVKDKDWLKSTYLTGDEDLTNVDALNRYYSTADLKFTDSTFGGNLAINARPQFTRVADRRRKGRRLNRNKAKVGSTSGNYGQGRAYSEKIDDPATLLFMEFGVPEFNNPFTFFTRSIDYATSVVANTGRSPIAYYAGLGLGTIASMVAFPLVSVAIYGVKLVSALVGDQEPFSYYYIKPTMHTYWGTVNTIVSTMAVELGILIPQFMDDGTTADKIGVPVKIDQTDMDYLKELIPDVITDNNYIDVFAIATRAQALANEQMLAEKKLFDEGKLSNEDFKGLVKTKLTDNEGNSPGSGLIDTINEALSLSTVPGMKKREVKSYSEFLDGYKSDSGTGSYDYKEDTIESSSDDVNNVKEEVDTSAITVGQPKTTIYNDDGTIPADDNEKSSQYMDSAKKAFDSAVRGGGQYAVFHVDYVGSVTESFSNSITDVPAGDMIRSVSNKSRHAKFSLGGGNIAGDTVKNALGYVKDFVAGTLEGLTFGLSNILPTLLGGGYINVPKMWDDSTVQLPNITYTMQLISPYGNDISLLRNIYIPLSMLLAGALPLSTGPASYTSPFLCRTFIKGLQKINLGMITELSITRGTSNLAFNKHGKALAYDISFTITDFSSMLSAPVNSGLFGPFKAAFNDGSTFNNYISTICARDLMSTKYAVPKAKIRLSRAMHTIDSIASPSYLGLKTGGAMSSIIGAAVADTSLSLLHKS